MLDTSDPAKLAEEINRAEQFRRKHTARGREIARRFMGNWYRNDNASEPTPENLVAGYIAFMLPELSYSDPALRISSNRPLTHKPIADFMELGINQWLKDADFGAEHQEVVRDFLINFGVMKVGMEPRDTGPDGLENAGPAGGATEALRPFAVRIPPDSLIMDPRCESVRSARYMGHKYWKDLDEIQAEVGERWDPEAVEQLSADDTGGDNDGQNSIERTVPLGLSGERNRVCLVDLWIPETGELVTLAQCGQDTLPVILRRVPYQGPRWGPITVFGAYTVPGDPYPISPLQFVMEQFEEMQAHITSSSEAASTYKRFILVEAAQVDMQNAILQAINGGVCAVRGLSAGNFQQVELGGPHPEQLAYIAGLRDRWDRVIGMGDAQRGRVAGKTAREAQIVQNNVDGRTAYLKKRVEKATRQVLSAVGWYLFHNPLVVMSVSGVDPISGHVIEGIFLGGPQDGQEMSWSDFDLQIIPESIGRTDDQVLQTRALQLLQLVPQILPLLQIPGLNVRYLVNMVGEAMNIKDLMDLLFNQQVLAMAGQAAAQQAQFAGMGQPPSVDPRIHPRFLERGLALPAAGAQGGPEPTTMANSMGMVYQEEAQWPR